MRKIEIVIDGFGDMDNAQASLCGSFECERGEARVISADRDQSGDAELGEAF